MKTGRRAFIICEETVDRAGYKGMTFTVARGVSGRELAAWLSEVLHHMVFRYGLDGKKQRHFILKAKNKIKQSKAGKSRVKQNKSG